MCGEGSSPDQVSTPLMKNDKWLIGLMIVVASAIGAVGAISIANAATLSEHKEAQKTQFEDIKARLVRIENKLDKLGERP